MNNTSLRLAINALPKDLRQEVADFVEFITRKNKARLNPKLKAREFGLLKGQIKLALEFDEPLEDFK